MLFNQGDAQQFNGREGETATLLFRCPLNSTLREFGFAPSRLNRSAFGDFTNRYRRDNKNLCPAQIRRLNFLCDDAQLPASLKLDSLEPTVPHSGEESVL